jgi:hypothetical protein
MSQNLRKRSKYILLDTLDLRTGQQNEFGGFRRGEILEEEYFIVAPLTL